MRTARVVGTVFLVGVGGLLVVYSTTSSGSSLGSEIEAPVVSAAQSSVSEASGASFVTLDELAEPLRSVFNADAGKVRLLLYVSPVCGGCLRAAQQIQQQLLEKTDDPNLAVYVMWAPKEGARARHVEPAARLVTDERAEIYWDQYSAVADPVDERMQLTGPCAGILMLYGPDAEWTAVEPPEPVYTEDAHAREFGRKGPHFNARRFSSIVMEALERV